MIKVDPVPFVAIRFFVIFGVQDLLTVPPNWEACPKYNVNESLIGSTTSGMWHGVWAQLFQQMNRYAWCKGRVNTRLDVASSNKFVMESKLMPLQMMATCLINISAMSKSTEVNKPRSFINACKTSSHVSKLPWLASLHQHGQSL